MVEKRNRSGADANLKFRSIPNRGGRKVVRTTYRTIPLKQLIDIS